MASWRRYGTRTVRPLPPVPGSGHRRTNNPSTSAALQCGLRSSSQPTEARLLHSANQGRDAQPSANPNPPRHWNVATLTFGLQAGWLSPLQPSFQSEDSPIGGPALTDEQISWIGSLPSISAILTTFLFGWTLDKYGRKFTLLLATLPNLLCYLLLICANNVTTIYIARIIGGFCSTGAFMSGPLYVNETVMPEWRGTLCGITGFFIKLGIILSFILGSYTSYLTLNVVSASFTFFFLFFVFWLPESPVYLIKQGKWMEAEEAWLYLWGKAAKRKVNAEIALIQREMCESSQGTTHLAMFKQFVSKRPLRTALIIVSAVFTCQTFCGYPAVVRYTVDIFAKSGITYSPHIAAIFLAIAQLISSFLGAVVIEKTGRKPLLIGSLISMVVFTAALSLYLQLKTHYDSSAIIESLRLLPTVALVGYIVSYAAGFGTVPFVLIPELFHPEMRAAVSTFSNMWYSVCEFIVLKLFPTLTNIIDLSGSLALFSVFGAIGAIFLSFYMFETKGLDYEGVQRKLGHVARPRVIQPDVHCFLTREQEKEDQGV